MHAPFPVPFFCNLIFVFVPLLVSRFFSFSDCSFFLQTILSFLVCSPISFLSVFLLFCLLSFYRFFRCVMVLEDLSASIGVFCMCSACLVICSSAVCRLQSRRCSVFSVFSGLLSVPFLPPLVSHLCSALHDRALRSCVARDKCICSAPIGKGAKVESDGVKRKAKEGRIESVVPLGERAMEGKNRKKRRVSKHQAKLHQAKHHQTHPSVVIIGLRASFFRFLIEPELAALSPFAFDADAGAVAVDAAAAAAAAVTVGSVCGVDCAADGSAEGVAPFIVGGRSGVVRWPLPLGKGWREEWREREQSSDARGGQRAHKKCGIWG